MTTVALRLPSTVSGVRVVAIAIVIVISAIVIVAAPIGSIVGVILKLRGAVIVVISSTSVSTPCSVPTTPISSRPSWPSWWSSHSPRWTHIWIGRHHSLESHWRRSAKNTGLVLVSAGSTESSGWSILRKLFIPESHRCFVLPTVVVWLTDRERVMCEKHITIVTIILGHGCSAQSKQSIEFERNDSAVVKQPDIDNCVQPDIDNCVRVNDLQLVRRWEEELIWEEFALEKMVILVGFHWFLLLEKIWHTRKTECIFRYVLCYLCMFRLYSPSAMLFVYVSVVRYVFKKQNVKLKLLPT